MNRQHCSVLWFRIATVLAFGLCGPLAELGAQDSDPEFEQILIERDGPVLIAKLHHPPRNFMTAQMVQELDTLIDWIEKNDQVRVLVITGGMPNVFIPGYSASELKETIETMKEKPGLYPDRELSATNKVYLKIEACPKPVIAAINGTAVGGGFELTLACDIRMMAEEAKVGLMEINYGICPGAGGSQRLPRLIGAGRAMDVLLRGRLVDAATAERYGIVTHTASRDQLLNKAVGLAKELSQLPPASLDMVKQCVHRGLKMPLEEGLRVEESAFSKLMQSEDAARLLGALIEKMSKEPDG